MKWEFSLTLRKNVATSVTVVTILGFIEFSMRNVTRIVQRSRLNGGHRIFGAGLEYRYCCQKKTAKASAELRRKLEHINDLGRSVILGAAENDRVVLISGGIHLSNSRIVNPAEKLGLKAKIHRKLDTILNLRRSQFLLNAEDRE
jgi:hypothetical protein